MGTREPSDEPGDAVEEAPRRRGVTRRTFVKYAAMAGVGAGVVGLGALSTLGIVNRPVPRPYWEIAPGVVDYATYGSGLEEKLTGPTPTTLQVAQWYDYWPGSFLQNFINYIAATYPSLPPIQVNVDIFTSNEELFEWITLGGKKYDVIFPTNHLVDTIKKGGFIYNLNTDWLPNMANLWNDFYRVPHGVDSADNLDQRLDPRDPGGVPRDIHFVSMPYFFGTTGIAFRHDKIPPSDVEAVGMDFFTMSSFTPTVSGFSTVDLAGHMRMLEDMRDVYSFGFKKAGQLWQESQGLPFSPYSTPYTDTSGKTWPATQWTSNETAPERVDAMGNWLFQCKPNLFDFNSTGDTPSLLANLAVLNQAWSGDVSYAQRPDQNVQGPVSFVLPWQGARWWSDTCCIHSESRNLWLAHQFINFVHSVSDEWPENQLLTRWNLYPTTNYACFQWLQTHPFPNGYDMTESETLYPNLLAPDQWALCDQPRDVGQQVLVGEYNPLWFDLTSE